MALNPAPRESESLRDPEENARELFLLLRTSFAHPTALFSSMGGEQAARPPRKSRRRTTRRPTGRPLIYRRRRRWAIWSWCPW